MDTLHLHQQLPAESTADKNQTEAEETWDQPEGIGLPESQNHLVAFSLIMKDPPKESASDKRLNQCDKNFFNGH